MMLPYPSIIVPLFILFKQLGWINTILPLVVPDLFSQPAHSSSSFCASSS